MIGLCRWADPDDNESWRRSSSHLRRAFVRNVPWTFLCRTSFGQPRAGHDAKIYFINLIQAVERASKFTRSQLFDIMDALG